MKKLLILTFGSCGWDVIRYADTKEIIYQEEGRKNSHQAVAASRSDADSVLISFVGDDEIGKKCLDDLKKCGVDTCFVNVVLGASTEINIQNLDRVTKDYTLERGPAELSQNYTPDMVKQYEKQIRSAAAVILVSKQPHDFLTAVIDFCYQNEIPTSLTISHPKFDINKKNDLETLKKVTYIAGNWEEAKGYTNKTTPQEMLKLLPNMIITKGAAGIYFLDEHGKFCHEEAAPVKKVVETNGCGDIFIGNFLVFRAEGKSKTESVRMAKCAAAFKAGIMGVHRGTPTRAQTEAIYRSVYNGAVNEKQT